MLQSRTYRKSVPSPGSCHRILPDYCCLQIAGNLALGVLFVAGSCLFYKDYNKQHDLHNFLLMSIFVLYSLHCIGQGCYWFGILRRVRCGELAELVYPKDFQVRSPAATYFSRAGVIALTALVAFFTVWGHRHSTRPGVALDLFLIGLNVATLWGVHHVFMRGSLILKSPSVRFQTGEYHPARVVVMND